jgi:hypothetical protein
MKTMSATKTLLLAAIGALALGTGAAMARSETIIYPGIGFAPPQVVTTGTAPGARTNQVQSGSSDRDLNASNPEDYRYQWGTLNGSG